VTSIRLPSIAAVSSPSMRVWRLVLFTGTVLGAGALLSKGLIDDGVDPFVVSSLPFLAGGLFACALAHRRGELEPRAFVPAAILGVTSSAAPALLFNTGFDYLPAGIVTLIIAIVPVFTALVAHFMYADERFNAVKGAGLALAICGVAVLALGPGADGDLSTTGLIATLLGTICAGSAAALARKYAMGFGARALIGPQLAVGGLTALILLPLFGRSVTPDGGFAWWHLPALIVVLGILSNYFGFRAMLLASEIGTTGQVSTVSYLIPLYGVIGGALIFGDRISANVVIGGAIILAAVGIIARGSRIVVPGIPAAVADRRAPDTTPAP